MTTKPGWKSSEFWITVFFQILVFRLLIWLIPGAGDSPEQMTFKTIESVFALVISGALVFQYIVSRSDLKQREK